jgi:hypothetical protein
MEIGIVERNPADPGYARTAAAPSAAETDRTAAGQLEEIRQYLRDRYARRDVVARTTTAGGQQLDWIPAESQTADGKIAEPPPAAEDGGATGDPTRRARTVPSDLGDVTPPPGTVPVLRKPVDQLRPTGTLQDWLAKGPRAKQVPPPDALASPAADDPHKYAHVWQAVTCFGTEGTINTWRPYVEWSNEFSLGQLWLVRGSGTGRQTVEVGAQTYYDLYHDWEPHLFIFYTTNGYTGSGDGIGGYNTDVDGWVQVSTSVYPGMRLADSIDGGDQYDLTLKVQLFAGNWWVRVGAEWMGYYPGGLYNASGLAFQADTVDWGGEIVDTLDHPEPTSTWMGSGRFPATGWQHAAYMRNLSYQSDLFGSLLPMQGFPSVTNPLSYDLAADFSGTTSWGSNFFWGGPGGI